MSDNITVAFERVVPIANLLAEIITYTRPGNYRFRTNHAEQYATWTETAAQFEASGVHSIKTVSYHMRRLSDALEKADNAVDRGRNAMRQTLTVHDALRKLLRAIDRYREWVIRHRV
ncbi:hypothetical protein B4V02_09130 [Paenibacillus kribbensis]|uniref:Uncharacterized protein n=1 Tax=Paenibacillus kribbensis TaxID=172713 RepID=A0A222WM22_9BACL|nr:hypothetical protein [Paenibacillus kribbensis]ASR46831.1 hypothetical protein B4V02_09130 [Paenibacillus kribbensis]